MPKFAIGDRVFVELADDAFIGTVVEGDDGFRIDVREDGTSRVYRGVHGSRLTHHVAPAEKRGPRVGDDVVRSHVQFAGGNVSARTHGKIVAVAFKDGDFAVQWEGQVGELWYDNAELGNCVILAADWDAQQKRNTDRCPPPVVAAKPRQLFNYGPPPEGRFDFLKGLSGDLNGPYPKRVFSELFAAKLAIAMFEDDNAGTLVRVADDNRGGIGTAAARERLVWRTTECQREQYMAEARALLKRAVEL